MKLILSLLVALSSFSLFALDRVETKVSFFSHNNFYSCDFVENQAAKILDVLGAENVELDCTGGLDYDLGHHSKWVSVKASFDVVSGGEVADASLRFRDSCSLNEKLFEKLSSHFEVSDLEKRGACFEHKGRLRYSFKVVK